MVNNSAQSPFVTIQKGAKGTTPEITPEKILIMDIMTSGTATSGELKTNVGSSGEEDALFGSKSPIAQAIRRIRKLNKYTQIDVIPLTNTDGVAATGSVAFSGTATQSGTLEVVMGSENDFNIEIPVSSGDTATALGAKLVAAMSLLGTLPVSGVNTTGTVALTYGVKGLLGNNIGLKVKGSVAGITVALTAFSGGTTTPTLPDIGSIVGDTRYTVVLSNSGFTGLETAVLTNFLDERYNADNNILDGVLMVGAVGAKATHTGRLTSLNSESYVYFADKINDLSYHKGCGFLEFPWVVAAEFAAAYTLRMTPNKELSSVVSTNVGDDRIGGTRLASLPMFNTPFNYINKTEPHVTWTSAEVLELKAAGVSVLLNSMNDSGVVSSEVVTTYKTDNAGNTDLTFKYLEHVKTVSVAAEFTFLELKRWATQKRFSGLAENGVESPASIKAKMLSIYDTLASSDYLCFRKDDEAKEDYKNFLTVTPDFINGVARINSEPTIVVQLRELIATMLVKLDPAQR